MASPFRYFRKHTKAFMAIAAVLAIFIFVVGGALKTGGRGQSGDRDSSQMVATWNGGSLNEGQLRLFISHRFITDQFLKQMFLQGGGSQYFPPNIPNLFLPEKRSNEYIQQQVLNTDVLSTLATQAGLTVSDNLIVHYIDEVGLKKVGDDVTQKILGSLGQRNAAQNEAVIFATLRKMLLAYFYAQMYGDQSQVVMPQERWDDWRKVNERISLQVAELPVDKFLPQVPEPTDAQLLPFFNEHKVADPNRIAQIGGQEFPVPDPGFAEPQRVRLAYLMGSVAQRAEKLEPSITEDEIKAYYEKNKAIEFLKMPGLGDSTTAPPAAATPPADAPPPAASTAPPANPTPPVDANKPAETPAPAASGTQPPAAAPAQPAPATPPAGAAQPAPGASQPKQNSSSAPRRSPFQFVGFQTPPAESAAPADGKAAAPATPTATADSQPADSPPPATPAAEAKPQDPAAAPPANPAPATSAEADKKEPAPEYEPLDKVRDDIRKKLASEKAETELDKVLGEAAAGLLAEYNRYGSQVAEARELQRAIPKPPAHLADLQWLADKLGLTYEKSAPLTILELRDTPYGQARDAANQAVSVTQATFLTLKPFEPFLARTFDGDGYIVLKTEDIPRRIPEFKEVRDQVVKAWKQQEAAKLAEKEAKKLADEAEKSPQPFDQFFAEKGYNVIKQTELFSWFSYPLGREGMGTPPGLSKIPELKNAEPTLMATAFGLADNKTAGLLNYDHSLAYVIRLNRRQYGDDELKKLFLEEEGPGYGQVGMTTLRSHIEVFDNAVNEELIKTRANFELDPEWKQKEHERLQKQQQR